MVGMITIPSKELSKEEQIHSLERQMADVASGCPDCNGDFYVPNRGVGMPFACTCGYEKDMYAHNKRLYDLIDNIQNG